MADPVPLGSNRKGYEEISRVPRQNNKHTNRVQISRNVAYKYIHNNRNNQKNILGMFRHNMFTYKGWDIETHYTVEYIVVSPG